MISHPISRYDWFGDDVITHCTYKIMSTVYTHTLNTFIMFTSKKKKSTINGKPLLTTTAFLLRTDNEKRLCRINITL